MCPSQLKETFPSLPCSPSLSARTASPSLSPRAHLEVVDEEEAKVLRSAGISCIPTEQLLQGRREEGEGRRRERRGEEEGFKVVTTVVFLCGVHVL